MQFTGFTNGLFIIAGGIAAALVLIEIARRMFSPEVLRRAHDITGNLLSVVGTLYAVLLGMIVVDAMVRFQTAIDIVQKESNSLADIFLLAERLPEPQKTRLQDACKSYAHQVVEKEWPLMADGFVCARVCLVGGCNPPTFLAKEKPATNLSRLNLRKSRLATGTRV